MKISITGFRGRVGTYLLNTYPSIFVPLDCDVTKPDQVRKSIVQESPDLILHLASKSGVDFCEEPINSEKVIATNVRGTFNVANEAERMGCGVVLMSSAYVFNGRKWFSGTYKETEHPDPTNFYGHSKLGAESLRTLFDDLKVIRTSYLFDEPRLSYILGNYHAGQVQYFPTFIKRSFMYLPHFAKCLVAYCLRFSEMPSVLHLSGSESVSWHQFVREWFIAMGVNGNEILPRSSQEDSNHAPRGKNLGLDVSLSAKLGFPQYSYRDGIREMCA